MSCPADLAREKANRHRLCRGRAWKVDIDNESNQVQ
jgi:hypothetical protein